MTLFEPAINRSLCFYFLCFQTPVTVFFFFLFLCAGLKTVEKLFRVPTFNRFSLFFLPPLVLRLNVLCRRTWYRQRNYFTWPIWIAAVTWIRALQNDDSFSTTTLIFFHSFRLFRFFLLSIFITARNYECFVFIYFSYVPKHRYPLLVCQRKFLLWMNLKIKI